MALIELKNAGKTYKMGEVDVQAVCGIDLKIEKGDFVSIAGPSGCGKSTLLNLVGFLDRPTKGTVELDGKEITELDDNELAIVRGQKVGFIFQTFNLITRMTSKDNVMLPMWFSGVDKDEREQRAKQLLENVGLGDRLTHKPSQLSGGQRQRVSIARALANKPLVILADEPTGNLDSKSGKQIINIISQLHKEEEKTIIMVTHEKKLAKKASRQVEMFDGKITKIKEV